MKKNLFVISTILVFGITAAGCATKGDLERVQAQEQQTNLKADQALKASQEATEAVKAADERARAAEERAKIAEARAERADAAFKGSMKK